MSIVASYIAEAQGSENPRSGGHPSAYLQGCLLAFAGGVERILDEDLSADTKVEQLSELRKRFADAVLPLGWRLT